MTAAIPISATLAPARPAPVPAPVLDVVIPVYNEEDDLPPCVRRLHAHLRRDVPLPVPHHHRRQRQHRLHVASRASSPAELPAVGVRHWRRRAAAVRCTPSGARRDAAVLRIMDVDLSTDLAALFPLVAPLVSGHSDIAVGSRLLPGSRVVRGPKREFISRCYNLLLRGVLGVRFSDAQCGFKAIRADVARQLLPLVEDSGWFFDTELLVLAERAGLRVHEVPVDWVDDPDSSVDIIATALADLRGMARLRWTLSSGRLALRELAARLRRPWPAAGPMTAG